MSCVLLIMLEIFRDWRKSESFQHVLFLTYFQYIFITPLLTVKSLSCYLVVKTVTKCVYKRFWKTNFSNEKNTEAKLLKNLKCKNLCFLYINNLVLFYVTQGYLCYVKIDSPRLPAHLASKGNSKSEILLVKIFSLKQ